MIDWSEKGATETANGFQTRQDFIFQTNSANRANGAGHVPMFNIEAALLFCHREKGQCRCPMGQFRKIIFISARAPIKLRVDVSRSGASATARLIAKAAERTS